MGGGVEGKRNKVLGAVPTLGEHYRPCVVTTGDTQDPFHTTVGIFINNHLLDKPFVIQSGSTVNRNNSDNLPDDWSCGATGKGSMTVDLFMSLCVHHVENNLKPKGYGAGKKASMLVFDGHTSRWSYAGLMFLMANNCWPFCIASHSSAWAQVSGSFVLTLHTNFILPPHPHLHPHCVCVCVTHFSLKFTYVRRWATMLSTRCAGLRSRRRWRCGAPSLGRTLRLPATISTSVLLLLFTGCRCVNMRMRGVCVCVV